MTAPAPISEPFLLALAVILALPYLVWRLGKTNHFAPLVVIQITIGVLLGPGALGAIFPAYYDAVFAPQVIGALNGIAWWAVILFVFVAGLELDLRSAWRWRGEAGLTAALALAAPLAMGAGAALALIALSGEGGWIGERGNRWQFVLGVGMACAVTALPILVLFMKELAILRTPLGQRVLRYASLDDIAIWGVLALILLDWERIIRQAGFLLGFAIMTVVMRRLITRIPTSDRWYVAFIWLAVCSYAADWSGLHFMVGAFLAGAALDAQWFEIERIDDFRESVLKAFMPVFFLSTGLRTSWEMSGVTAFAAAGLFLLAMVAGKLIGTGVAGRLIGWRKGEAWAIGWLLQTKALIMIIFANILLDKQLITSATFTALLLSAIASTMLTVPMARPALRRIEAVGPEEGEQHR